MPEFQPSEYRPEDIVVPETTVEVTHDDPELEAEQLFLQYKNVPDDEFKISQRYLGSKVRQTSHGEQERIPQYEKMYLEFIKDVSRICDKALEDGYDRMLFLDRSARGYGLLAQRLLPIIRLSRARQGHNSLSSMVLPPVDFVNPPLELKHMADRRQSIETVLDTPFIQQFRDGLGTWLNGHRVLVVDESHNLGRSARGMTEIITLLFPSTTVKTIHGNSSTIGGNDAIIRGLSRNTKVWPSHKVTELAYNIQQAGESLGDSAFVNPLDTSTLTAKDMEFMKAKGFDTVENLQRQVVLELDMMAKYELNSVTSSS